MYMLDTNICVSVIREKHPNVLSNLNTKRSLGLSISTITLAELEHGVNKSSRKEQNAIALASFLSIIEIRRFDEKAARMYGAIKADIERRGCVIGSLDILIAAHAKSAGTILATNNTREFERVQGLRIEDWISLT
ncbi:twitching motility protein PilT [Synergistales bacterium]|nr:twitching motility protein PilT [Synergistales bacterium]